MSFFAMQYAANESIHEVHILKFNYTTLSAILLLFSVWVGLGMRRGRGHLEKFG